MTFKECKEKYPLGSYIIVKHKKQEDYSWFQVNDYVITISGPFFKTEALPGWRDPKNGFICFNPKEYDIIQTFPNYQTAEKYISRI